jgi:hypothetical protein
MQTERDDRFLRGGHAAPEPEPEQWTDLFERPPGALDLAISPREAARYAAATAMPPTIAAGLYLQVLAIGVLGMLLGGSVVASRGGEIAVALALLAAMAAASATLVRKVLARREWARLVLANVAAMYAMMALPWLLLGLTRPTAGGALLLLLLGLYAASAAALYLPGSRGWFDQSA